jgi:hypothetical protein
MWSVKRNGYNTPASWPSFGDAATSINMVKQGVDPFSLSGANADLISLEDVQLAAH